MNTEMTELQRARAKWLDAETRACKAERRCAELQKDLFDLKGDLVASQINAAVEGASSFHRGFVAALNTRAFSPAMKRFKSSYAMGLESLKKAFSMITKPDTSATDRVVFECSSTLGPSSVVSADFARTLETALRFMVEQIDDPANAKHTLEAYRLGIGMHQAREALK